MKNRDSHRFHSSIDTKFPKSLNFPESTPLQAACMDKKATGRDIILALVENMRESREPLLYDVLVPSHYDVYLHQDDYDRLTTIFPRIREEARKALTEEMARLGRKGFSLLPGLKSKPPKHEAAEGDWYIKFHHDEDEELAPGDILIDSRLALPPAQDYGVGSKTQRTVTVRSGGETKKLKRPQETQPGGVALAKLTYQDKDGQRREYLMTSAEIAIGRGGRAEYCDLQLDAPADISRQHFYLRQDAETREFFIQDVSRFGTSVDGKNLAPKEWVRIPPKATIKLADKIVDGIRELMTFLYWARYGFLAVLVLAIACLIYAHFQSIRPR